MANPLINLGQLNRLKSTIVIPNLPQLNITPSFIGQEGLRVAPEGDATGRLPAMTGVVNSPEPYIPVTIQVPLLKTLGLSDLYKQQLETDTQLGDLTVRPDVTRGLGIFSFTNGAIMNVGEMDFGGRSYVFGVSIQAVWLINADLWN